MWYDCCFAFFLILLLLLLLLLEYLDFDKELGNFFYTYNFMHSQFNTRSFRQLVKNSSHYKTMNF